MNKKVFDTFRDDEKNVPVRLYVLRPSLKLQVEGDRVYSKKLFEEVEAGKRLLPKIEQFMKQNNLWTEEHQKNLEELDSKIIACEKALKVGGLTKLEGRKIALELRSKRTEKLSLLSEKTYLNGLSAETSADNERFNFYVSMCTYADDTDKLYFASLDDYKDRMSEQAAVDAATNLATLLYSHVADWENSLPENQFLTKYNYVNKDLRLVNSDGHLVDEDFRLIDAEGYYVNEVGDRVDRDGNPVDQSETIGEFAD